MSAPHAGAARPEPTPRVRHGQPHVLDLVIADLHARADMGERKYGTRLQAFNGRDALVDAYQEAIDLVMYLRQALAERFDDTHEEAPMENQHQMITGYRDLGADEIALMNAVKAKGEELGALCEQLAATPGIDGRWVAIGKTQLQQGIMALVRAVARPTSF